MAMKLMLVDDHPLFMEGLQYLLETHGIHVAGLAKNGREAIEKARILQPEIILMDIQMPECTGLDALKVIKGELPEIKVIMLTTSEEDEDLFDALRFGASGYLFKNTSAKELVEMLSDIEKGEVPLSPGLAARILREFRSSGEAKVTDTIKETFTETIKETLTERQLEVLELVVKGMTYKEVGDILFITERTVKYHMGRIIELLHLKNRAQVIAYTTSKGN